MVLLSHSATQTVKAPRGGTAAAKGVSPMGAKVPSLPCVDFDPDLDVDLDCFLPLAAAITESLPLGCSRKSVEYKNVQVQV